MPASEDAGTYIFLKYYYPLNLKWHVKALRNASKFGIAELHFEKQAPTLSKKESCIGDSFTHLMIFSQSFTWIVQKRMVVDVAHECDLEIIASPEELHVHNTELYNQGIIVKLYGAFHVEFFLTSYSYNYK